MVDIETEPEYIAVSYQWGWSFLTHILELDGDTLRIGENCWFAPEQLHDLGIRTRI